MVEHISIVNEVEQNNCSSGKMIGCEDLSLASSRLARERVREIFCAPRVAMGQRKNPFDPDVNVRILLILGASPDPAHLVSSLEASSSPAFAQVRSQTVWETNALHLADAVKKNYSLKKKNQV